MKKTRLTGDARRLHAEQLMAKTQACNRDAVALFQKAVAAQLSTPAEGPSQEQSARPPCILLKTHAHTGQLEAIGRMLAELPDDGGYRRPVLSFAHTHKGAAAMAEAFNAQQPAGARTVAGVRLTRENAGCQRLDEVGALLKAGLSPGRLCLGLDGTPCPFFEGCRFQHQRTKLHLVPDADGMRRERGHDGTDVYLPVGTVTIKGETRDVARHADMEMTFVAPSVHAMYESQPPVPANAAGIVLNEVSPLRWLRWDSIPLSRLQTAWTGSIAAVDGEAEEAIACRDQVAQTIAQALSDDDLPTLALADAFGGAQEVLDALAIAQAVLKPQDAADRISTQVNRSGRRRDLQAFAHGLQDRVGARREWHLLEALKRAFQLGVWDDPDRVPLALHEETVEFGYRHLFPWPRQPLLVIDPSANPVMWHALIGDSHDIKEIDNPVTPEDLYRLGLEAVMYADHSGKPKQLLPLDDAGWEHQNAHDSKRKLRDRDVEISKNRAELVERVRDERSKINTDESDRAAAPEIAVATHASLLDYMIKQDRKRSHEIRLSNFGGPALTFGSIRGSAEIDAAGIAMIGCNEPHDSQLRQLRLALRTTLPEGHVYAGDAIVCKTAHRRIDLAGTHQRPSFAARHGENRLTRDLLHEIRDGELQCAFERIAPFRRLCDDQQAQVVVFGKLPVPGLVLSRVVTRDRESGDARLAAFQGVVSRPAVERAHGMSSRSASNWLKKRGFTLQDHPPGWRAFKVVVGRSGPSARIWVHETVDDPGAAERHALTHGMDGTVVADTVPDMPTDVGQDHSETTIDALRSSLGL